MNKLPYSYLRLKCLKIPVHLGTSHSERQKMQIVQANITIAFHQLPKGCMTDELENTICYATLIESIRKFCQTKPFQLIEHLGYQLYLFLKKEIDSANIQLQIEKQPDIEGLGYCTFDLNDGVLT